MEKSPTTTKFIPNSNTMSETERIKLTHALRDPAHKVDIVPVVHSKLLSGLKLADTDYVTILYK